MRSTPPDLDTLPPVPYAYLLGLYLGDGWIARMAKGTFSLRISLDRRYPRIVAGATPAVAEVNPRIDRRSEVAKLDSFVGPKR